MVVVCGMCSSKRSHLPTSLLSTRPFCRARAALRQASVRTSARAGAYPGGGACARAQGRGLRLSDAHWRWRSLAPRARLAQLRAASMPPADDPLRAASAQAAAERRAGENEGVDGGDGAARTAWRASASRPRCARAWRARSLPAERRAARRRVRSSAARPARPAPPRRDCAALRPTVGASRPSTCAPPAACTPRRRAVLHCSGSRIYFEKFTSESL